MNSTALIIIDVQNDYFDGGKMALSGAEEASENIHKVLTRFRQEKMVIIHVQHESTGENATFFLPNTRGQKIHSSVQPIVGEKIIRKNFPNSFLKTGLLKQLQEMKIKRLVITGMMTFMCVDATTRAAKDLEFECVLLHDCTATPPTQFNGIGCSAEQARAAFTCALSHICNRVISADELLDEM